VFDVDFIRVMSWGGGVIGSSAMAIRRTPSISGAAQRRKGTLDGASILPPNFAVYLWTFQWKRRIFFVMSKGKITDRFSVGGVGKLPQREIPFDHEKRPKTARARDGEPGADRKGAGRLLKLEGKEER